MLRSSFYHKSDSIFSKMMILSLSVSLAVGLSLPTINPALAAGTADASQTAAASTPAPAAVKANTSATPSSTPLSGLALSSEFGQLLKSDIDHKAIMSDPATTTASDIGATENSTVIPTKEKLARRLKAIDSDKDLDDAQKERMRAIINRGFELLTLYQNITKEESRIDSELAQGKDLIASLENTLSEANVVFTKEPPEITVTNADELNAFISNLAAQLTTVQTKLNEATSSYNSLQTLPNRAQNQIAVNNTAIYEISRRLEDQSDILLPDEIRILPFERLVLEKQNTLLQNQLKSLTTFQDIATYKMRINTLHKDYLNNYLTKARAKLSTMLDNEAAKGVNADDAQKNAQYQDAANNIAALESERHSNQEIIAHIDKVLDENALLKKELSEVTDGLAIAAQVDKSMKDQLSDLTGSVILSRLLNRQLGELPDVDISFNLDETIPNLNLWMYELRSYREQIFDVQTYVDNMIAKNKAYAPYREELVQLIRERRSLTDELYSAMSDGMTLATDLRTKYQQLTTLTNAISTQIKDNLFWLESNQGISIDFFLGMPAALAIQTKNFLTYMATDFVSHEIFLNYLKVFLPILLFGFLFSKAKPFFKQKTNSLALMLDKENDGYLVTPRALYCHFFLVIPRVAFITFLGSLVIFFTIDNFAQQKEMTFLLSMHLMCFLYVRQIMEPNSLVQRHFCVSPKVISRNRRLIDKLWYVSIPMLMIANMRELEPTKISNDVIGFMLMFLGFLYLTGFAINQVRHNLNDKIKPTLSFWILAAFGILTPLTITVMLGLGYYYTIIQLLNRVAITLYIGFLYVICSNTLRRELHVAENKINAAIRKYQLSSLHDPKGQPNNSAASANNNPEKAAGSTMRSELVNNRAFKLFNACLLTVFLYFMYLQWNDLAGVLGYLDHIYLWQDVTVVNGQTITSTLSLGDLLLAVVIIVVAVILHRNLPLLVERLLMLRKGVAARSTSYTVKLIVSYVITTLGIILAAGAIGITWDNLQWLVAALSVGLGFGLQEIFGNFVSGIIILFERQLRVGDIVTLSNLSGTVNKIRIRATTIVSFDNKEVVIPNKQFITSAVTNWSLSNTVTKLEFAIGVAYDADTAKAKDLLRGILRRCRDLNREKKPLVYIKSLDASCITIMCEVFVNEIGKRKIVYDYLSSEALRLFNLHGIEVPFDQVDVTIRNLDTNKTITYTEENLMQAAALAGAAASNNNKKKAALLAQSEAES